MYLLKAEWWVEKILWLIFAYISLVPYYYMQEQELTEHIPVFSLIKYFPFLLSVLALAIWLGERVWKKKRYVFSWSLVCIALYMGVTLLSLWRAEFAHKGLAKWVYYNATGCGLAFLIVQYGQNFARRLALWMLCISGIVISYTCIIAILGFDPIWGELQAAFNPYYTQARVTGPFGHTVATATYAMFLFPLAFWGFLSLRQSAIRWLWGGVCFLYIPVVLLTQTRGALLAVCICLLLMIPWFKKGIAVVLNIDKRYFSLWLSAGLVVLLVLMRGGDVGGWVEDRWSQIGERWRHVLEFRPIEIEDNGKVYKYVSLLEYTERFRIAQYKTVGNILDEHPLLGVGFGTFTLSFDKYKYTEDYIEWEFPEHTTENMYLMVLAETGWVGLISWLLVLVWIYLQVFRAYRNAGLGLRRHLLLAYLAATGGLYFNMLTWDILNEPTLRMSYWLFTGLVLAHCPVKGEVVKPSSCHG